MKPPTKNKIRTQCVLMLDVLRAAREHFWCRYYPSDVHWTRYAISWSTKRLARKYLNRCQLISIYKALRLALYLTYEAARSDARASRRHSPLRFDCYRLSGHRSLGPYRFNHLPIFFCVI